MTKLDWGKVNLSVPDPARVIEVIDSGIWSGNDARPFVPRSQQLAKARKKRAKLLQRAKQSRLDKQLQLTKSTKAASLRLSLVPLNKVPLIKSVMKDLGRYFPRKRAAQNKMLSQLIEERIILADGDFNIHHPVMQEWLHRVERRATSKLHRANKRH